MTLTEFLTARLDEDATEARQLLHEDQSPADAVAYGNRVLREVEAKRAIVAWVIGAQAYTAAGDEQAFHDEEAAALSYPLRHLAAVYSDHPDYDEEWRP